MGGKRLWLLGRRKGRVMTTTEEKGEEEEEHRGQSGCRRCQRDYGQEQQ